PAEPAPSPAPAMPRAEPLATDAPAAPVPPVTPAAGASAEPAYVGDPEPSQLPDFEPAAPAPTDSASQPAEVPLAAAAAKPKGKSPVGLILSVLVLALVAGGGVYAWQTGALDGLLGQSEPQTAEEEALPVAPDNDVRQVGGTDPTRSSERLLPDNQGTVEEPLETETPSAETPVELSPPESDATETTQAPEEPAAEEAAPETEVAAAPTEPGLPVAQTAILYEEGLTPEATGFTAPGRTVWRLEGGDSDPVIVGTVEIPNRGISMNLRVSRNLDAALPASHLLEFTFNLADGFPAESIAELVGVVVKPEEQSGGDPLRGAIVDLGSGVFWQALAAGDADVAVNLPLLRDGRWFDLPVLYADNRRAIISFEKGVDGERVFNEALAAWSN
ncbi:MAG: hypothetical protein KI785_03800, partial [Devosiaceae bacterium]|nr:hypothetical protein [Devosiaceae bacterium MH13]